MKMIYSIEGEFITQFTRTKCYEEHRAKYAIDLLYGMINHKKTSYKYCRKSKNNI